MKNEKSTSKTTSKRQAQLFEIHTIRPYCIFKSTSNVTIKRQASDKRATTIEEGKKGRRVNNIL
jgi:hypothetical protein